MSEIIETRITYTDPPTEENAKKFDAVRRCEVKDEDIPWYLRFVLIFVPWTNIYDGENRLWIAERIGSKFYHLRPTDDYLVAIKHGEIDRL